MPIQIGSGARPGLPVAPCALALMTVVLLAPACGTAPEPNSNSRGRGGGAPPATPARAPAPPAVPDPDLTPTPGLIEPVAGKRDRVLPWRVVGPADGPAAMVEVQLGGSPCDVVTGMDVKESADAVRLTLWAGPESGARCQGVPALLGTFHVRVPLAAPLGNRHLKPSASGD